MREMLIEANGDWDMATVDAWRETLFEVIDSNEPHSTGTVLLDLTRVTFMDSSGFLLLTEFDTACRARNYELVLRGPSARLQRTMTILGLDDVFHVRPGLSG